MITHEDDNINEAKYLEFPFLDDVLFSENFSDWRNNALLGYSQGKFSFYADGYREGAHRLIAQCVNADNINDILVFPAVFLYRQYVELRLKENISGLNYCINATNDFPRHHKIDILWNEFKKLYEATGGETNTEVFMKAQRIVEELAKVDPISIAFRYPIDKEGNQSLNLTHINLRNFGEVMDRLANLLDAISDQIAHYKDLSNDMYRDYY